MPGHRLRRLRPHALRCAGLCLKPPDHAAHDLAMPRVPGDAAGLPDGEGGAIGEAFERVSGIGVSGLNLGRRAECPDRFQPRPSSFPRADKEFPVAGAAGDRGGDAADDAPARLPSPLRGGDGGGVRSAILKPALEVLHGLFGDLGVAHDSAFAERRAPDLELRLHQEHAPCARLGKSERRRQRKLQRDEAQVGDDRADLSPVKMRAGEVAGVHAFKQSDARIAGEPRMKLAVADVDGDDVCGAALKQRLR